ncbi:hypothetical protein [uncultured Hyphomicrobium sp.]|uniref:hypothetical protein n=1 Tax=uncultured Hyphomicrobium sp. TaxID=194373 RepID=UPI002600AAB4|nr:hypothetical protein [uncultured Hyphomicrobium sp.]
MPAAPPDLVAAQLLDAAFARAPLSIFDQPVVGIDDEKERLALLKLGADLIVKTRLAKFDDEGRTSIVLTNAGRYWALSGGWLAYLREEPLAVGGGGRARNPETEALRSEYMRLRLNTFWWSFGLSIAGFVFSVISVLIAIFYGDRVLPR